MQVREQLEKSRRELLDLSTRNRLLSCSAKSRSGLRIVDEHSDDIYRILVKEGRSMSFLAGRGDPAEEESDIGQLDFGQPDVGDLAPDRHTDNRLQTALTDEQLQRKLLRLYRDSRTLLEEQGINTLFLALGFLWWRESASLDRFRRAPLLLIPVQLDRTSVRARFRVAFDDEDIGPNLSLEEKLRLDFRIELPTFPDPDELEPSAYFGAVRKAVKAQAGWRVETDEMQLGFFSFTKLLMYRDLDPKAWPEGKRPHEHPILSGLLGDDGLAEQADAIPENAIDEHPESSDLATILDADSSQVRAMIEARQARTMVIQGPPGTGKSQTIANLIADAVQRGKRLLFVAEKMAALQVVKRRLDENGIGAACLELHSRGANKRVVLQELDKTLDLGRPVLKEARRAELERLQTASERLSRYAKAVNQEIGETGISPRIAFVRARGARKCLDHRAPAIALAGANEWTLTEASQKRTAVEELQSRVREGGPPRANPFWGSRRTLVLPSDIETLYDVLGRIRSRLEALDLACRRFGESTGTPVPKTAAEASLSREAVNHLDSAPELGGCELGAPEWGEHPERLDLLLTLGDELKSVRSRFDSVLLPEAWGRDVLQLRADLRATGRSWFRFFLPRWRSARSQFEALCAGEPPRKLDEILDIVDGVLQESRIRSRLDAERLVYESVFEKAADWAATDWTLRRAQAQWVRETRLQIAADNLPDWILKVGPARLRQCAGECRGLGDAVTSFEASRSESREALDLDESKIGPDGFAGLDFHAAKSRIETMAEHLGALRSLAAYNQKAQELRTLGMEPLLEACEAQEQAGLDLVALFDLCRYEALIRRAFEERPELRQFDRAEHEQVVQRFQELDRLQFDIHRRRAALSHYSGLPKADSGGRMGLLRRQMAKRRGHLPIRELVEQAGVAVQAVKPVFLMSPLSVAKFLPPNSVDFDLVVFDEASQVRAVDGFGAILRGTQVIVVGDSKQLPPTDFFDSVVREQDDDEEHATADIESLLKQMESRGARQTMLQWHYRSRHESLIAFSNRAFYDSRLCVFPSPVREGSSLGLRFRHLPDTVYLRGHRKATNPSEAAEVADAVMQHARKQLTLPAGEGETLLVATFSAAQRDAVDNALERSRRLDDSCEQFFASSQEPFEVKNLENVQGDERDVIFISVGYGRDEHGKVSRNFGPLNRDGGERRLNVLCTRARRRCVVFSNIRAVDLAVDSNSPDGVRAFKQFLHYAEFGDFEVVQAGTGETESEFEDQVLHALQQRGFQVDAQVGSAGYRIDLSVRDESRPGRYLIGIECDGACYHSARSARDRDRLREEVLRRLGWRIHRIWSTAWFHDPDLEIDRVVSAIEDAKITPDSGDTIIHAAPSSEIERHEEDSSDSGSAERAAQLYGQANLQIRLPRGFELHETPSTTLATWLEMVTAAEGPVHFDIATRRIALAVGVQRRGNRIQEAFERALRLAIRQNRLLKSRGFLSVAEGATLCVRDRSNLDPTEKKIEYVPPEEIDFAVRQILGDAHGVKEHDIPSLVARRLGLGRTSKDVRTAIASRVQAAVRKGNLVPRGGYLECAPTDQGEGPSDG